MTLEAEEQSLDKSARPSNSQDPFIRSDSPYITGAPGTPAKPSAVDASTAIPDPDLVDRFEDVTLADPKPKRHGLFSRFVGGNSNSTNSSVNPTSSDPDATKTTSSTHNFFGRKRGGSGQGAELGNMVRRPASRGPSAVAASAGATATPASLDKTGGLSAVARSSTSADGVKGPSARPQTPNIVEKNAAATAIGRSQAQTPVSVTEKKERPQTPVSGAAAPAVASSTPTTTAAMDEVPMELPSQSQSLPHAQSQAQPEAQQINVPTSATPAAQVPATTA